MFHGVNVSLIRTNYHYLFMSWYSENSLGNYIMYLIQNSANNYMHYRNTN